MIYRNMKRDCVYMRYFNWLSDVVVTNASCLTKSDRGPQKLLRLRDRFSRQSLVSLSFELHAATPGLLATDHVILNHGQVTWTTPELAPPLLTTTPHQREDVSALDRLNVHRCPTRRVFSGTGLELVTRQATVRYLYHSATAAIRAL
ncbi:uncharacterized protein TNCV_2084521 [Trichonephila clavipes]|uniref:Uncharacterized protein n=1 Tax=Trichonephila clavipes TaxID=2585209 RepID=A0A8X6RN98_TRICX|nr:uncharacterized protein TNCV_2084521 [Trichonephila clavipes]